VETSYQRQQVELPSGVRYWTVVDEDFERVDAVDAFLRSERLSRDRSETTTGQYASNLAAFLNWAVQSGRGLDWVACAEGLEWFLLHMRTTPILRRGRGVGEVRSPGRINDVLASVRSLYRYLIRRGTVEASVSRLLYDVAVPAAGAAPWAEALPDAVLRPVHKLSPTGESSYEEVTLGEFVAMLSVPAPLRDKLLITVMALAGLRVNQALGLHRSDMHLMANSRAVGCAIEGPHIHVVRREDNANRALSKRRRELKVPAHPWVVAVYSAVAQEREKHPAAAASDYVFVNLGGGQIGAPMKDHRAREVVTALARRAGIERVVTPHQFRHGLGTALADAGRPIDEIQMILGHASLETTRRYVQTSRVRQRAAIESVPLPGAAPEFLA
jgi:integrase/recombinase XerD